VSILVPDLSGYDQEISAIGKKIEEVGSALVRKRREAEAEAAAVQGEARNYLVLVASYRKRNHPDPEQMANLKKLAARVAPALKVLNQLNGEVRVSANRERDLRMRKNAALMRGKQDASAGASCPSGSLMVTPWCVP